MTNVPLLDLGPQNRALEAQFEAAFRDVLRSNQFIMGPRLEAFEQDCAAFLGVKHAFGVSSGTDALLLALMALGVGEGDEVLIPSFTFFATAGSVARLGATPVWVDVDPHTFNLDLADAARKTGPRARVIMPVHLFGQSCDLDAVQAFAAAHKLRVVEDAAQSMGARWKGRPTMSAGDFGATSFFPSKNLGGMGDSGLVTTQDDALAERARILRVHGMQPKYHHREVGANFRMDPLQAALLHLKLPQLPGYNRFLRPRHLEPVHAPRAGRPARRAQGLPHGAQDRLRDLLPHPAPPSGMLRGRGLSRRRPRARLRAARRRSPQRPDLPRAHSRAAPMGRRLARRFRGGEGGVTAPSARRCGGEYGV